MRMDVDAFEPFKSTFGCKKKAYTLEYFSHGKVTFASAAGKGIPAVGEEFAAFFCEDPKNGKIAQSEGLGVLFE